MGLGDYEPVGSFEKGKRAFQTLNRMISSNTLSSEEMHYAYDTAGRLRQAAFAQSPQTGSGAPTSAPFYTASYPAASRAVAFYDYDGGGRPIDLQQGWQNWTGSSYGATQCILRNSCAYDLTRNLKTDSFFYGPATGNPTAWTSSPRDEQYGYDPNFDYLTSANYNDGLANQAPTWSYDADGNRTDSTVDDLNRTEVQVNGQWQTNCDTLGNRLFLGTATYSWDAMNRMTQYANAGTTTSYEYRADGMRTHKSSSSGYTEYYHDGQMPIEDVNFSGGAFTVNRYGIGARGIDYMESGTGATRPMSCPNVGFPLYDVHGNMIATLSRAGGGTFAVNNQRSYDAWGTVRQGAGTGDPKNRYCASLGHQQDDESSLIYIRARYYEPTTGRFLTEDPQQEGPNWFAYAGDEPVGNFDYSGTLSMGQAFLVALISSLIQSLSTWLTSEGFGAGSLSLKAAVLSGAGALIKGIVAAIFGNDSVKLDSSRIFLQKLCQSSFENMVTGVAIGIVVAIYAGIEAGQVTSELLYIDYGT